MDAQLWRRALRRTGSLVLAAGLIAAGLTQIDTKPASAAVLHLSKATMCAVMSPCEPPLRYQSGPFLAKPRIVQVSMRQVQAICLGNANAARDGNGTMGCAQLTGAECIVHISTSLKSISPDLYDLVLAHELGHCRGWRH